jgi:hypothetical protein
MTFLHRHGVIVLARIADLTDLRAYVRQVIEWMNPSAS